MAQNLELQSLSGFHPDVGKGAVLYGSAKPQTKENLLVRIVKEQNPIAHAEQLMHIVDERIVPKLAPMDQHIAWDLRPGIETAALLSGTAMTAAQIAIPVIAGMRLMRAGQEYIAPKKMVREKVRKVMHSRDTGSRMKDYFSLRQIAGLPETNAGDFETEARRAERKFQKAVAGRKRIGVLTDKGEWKEMNVSPRKLGELTDMFRHVIRTRPDDATLRDLDIAIANIWGAREDIPGAYDRNTLAMNMITEWGKTLPKPVSPNDMALLAWLWESTGFIGLPRENWQDMRAFTNRFPLSEAEAQRIRETGQKTQEWLQKRKKKEEWGVRPEGAPFEYPYDERQQPANKLYSLQGGYVPQPQWIFADRGGIDPGQISIVDTKRLQEERRKRLHDERTLKQANRLGKADWKHPHIAAGISAMRERTGDTSVVAYDVARLFDRVPEMLQDEKNGGYVRRLLGRLQLEQEFGTPAEVRGVARQLFDGLNRTNTIFYQGERLWQAADYWQDTLQMASLRDLLPQGPTPAERRDFLERTFAHAEPKRLIGLIIRRIAAVSKDDETTPAFVIAASARIKASQGRSFDITNTPSEMVDLVSKGYRLLLDTRSEAERRIYDKIRAERGVTYEYRLYDGEMKNMKRLAHHIMTHDPQALLKPLIDNPKFSEKKVTIRENKKMRKFVGKLKKYMKRVGAIDRMEEEELRKKIKAAEIDAVAKEGVAKRLKFQMDFAKTPAMVTARERAAEREVARRRQADLRVLSHAMDEVRREFTAQYPWKLRQMVKRIHDNGGWHVNPEDGTVYPKSELYELIRRGLKSYRQKEGLPWRGLADSAEARRLTHVFIREGAPGLDQLFSYSPDIPKIVSK